jgi:hypothetical protein
MALLPQKVNADELPRGGSGGLPLIPPGTYQGVFVQSEMKETANKDGQYLQLTLVITNGEHEGTEFVERLNLVNKNEKAMEIAYRTLGNICEAVGFTGELEDSNALHNKPLAVVIKTEEGTTWRDKDNVEREGKDKSIIGGYKKLSAVNSSPAAAQPPAAQEGAAQPAQAPSTPPWAAGK